MRIQLLSFPILTSTVTPGLGKVTILGSSLGTYLKGEERYSSSLRRHNCPHGILYMSGIGHERKFSGTYIRLGGLGVATSVPPLSPTSHAAHPMIRLPSHLDRSWSLLGGRPFGLLPSGLRRDALKSNTFVVSNFLNMFVR